MNSSLKIRLLCAGLTLALAAGASADPAPAAATAPVLVMMGSMDPALQVQYTSQGATPAGGMGTQGAAAAAGGPLAGIAGYVIGTMVSARMIDNMASSPQEQRAAPIRAFYDNNNVLKLVADAVSASSKAADPALDVQTEAHDANGFAERAAGKDSRYAEVVALQQQTFVSQSLECLKTEFSYRVLNGASVPKDDDVENPSSSASADEAPHIVIYFDYHNAEAPAATAASAPAPATVASAAPMATSAAMPGNSAGQPVATASSGAQAQPATPAADSLPAGWATASPEALKGVFAASGQIIASLLPRLLHHAAQPPADYVIATTDSHEKIRGYQLQGIGDWVVMRDDNANYFVIKPMRLSVLRKAALTTASKN